MASLTLLTFPTAGISPVTVMAASAAKGASGSEKKPGFLDWLSDALDKDGLLETDPILNKVDGPAPPIAKPGKKGAEPKKQGGGGFFGLGKK